MSRLHLRLQLFVSLGVPFAPAYVTASNPRRVLECRPFNSQGVTQLIRLRRRFFDFRPRQRRSPKGGNRRNRLVWSAEKYRDGSFSFAFDAADLRLYFAFHVATSTTAGPRVSLSLSLPFLFRRVRTCIRVCLCLRVSNALYPRLEN